MKVFILYVKDTTVSIAILRINNLYKIYIYLKKQSLNLLLTQ